MDLPSNFIAHLEEDLDTQLAGQLIRSIQEQEAPVSIRVNPLRRSHPTSGLEPVPWCETGYYLPERPVFTKDPVFHAGGYYVQEASSMALEQAFRQTRPDHPIRILDLCAAPGGKSTHLLSMMRDEDLLIANEVINSRAGVLHENVTKWGNDNCIVTNSDPRSFFGLRGFFDLIVIDAPCSGEGMFRKDPGAVQEWSMEHVRHCGERQQRIITDAWDSLAEDGVLIYSTCTFNRRENEEVLQWLIENYSVEPIELALEQEAFITYQVNDYAGYKLLPGLVKGEGYSFFVLRKSNGPERWEPAKQKKKKGKESQKTGKAEKIKGLRAVDQLSVFDWDGKLIATRFEKELEYLREHLKVIKSGVRVGELKKNKMVPAHELALSTLLDPEEWPETALNYDQAHHFLMKEPFDIPATERGFHRVTFKGWSLGWINHLGNRFNNLYPNNWRIQRDFRNEEPFTLA